MAGKKRFGLRLRELFSLGGQEDDFYEELEDLLIEADLGASVTMALVDHLRESRRSRDREGLLQALRELLLDGLAPAELNLDPQRLNVVLFLGVNGVGKTTNLAKCARWYQREWPQAGILLAAGDTFRAAAVEQLSLHAERLGVRIVRQGTGSDAGAVVYDAITSAQSRGERLVLADTAGRMHNRADLVRELEKIHGIIRKLTGSEAVYRKILVIDGTTGQNALRQAELFHEAVGVDAVLLSKYDSSARGGVLVPLQRSLGLQCGWLGTGESYEDLRRFSPEAYVDDLLAP
ncbi:signal recognition particle-docking protein FtsY [Alkalispirochaeta sphaeroplastigenens]|uniref:Signal recognition particle-docking protein FtsY n=1 Tax=Alkalispirochaeta sphaeroplastigenens TaxID=1187066 RepID=A0A2S4JQ87_9SPIO|nr:signal recognition particle-docking protein FtsY [Alkalispirochaeta sphaeroplastigenens]POR01643.1 signal recognition particle-docking protein FtsY [Alkalispirochaeta sphaeroplastigenens]